MSSEDDDDPMNWSVADFLREYQRIMDAYRNSLPASMWWDPDTRRTQEIEALDLTRPLALGELLKIKPQHHHRGPEKDDHDDDCAIHKFKYQLSSGVDVYVKIGVKKHPKKRGIYVAKTYSFKKWI